MHDQWAINWYSADPTIIDSEYYQQFANVTFENVSVSAVKAALNKAQANRNSSAVVAYLCWLLRVKALLA